MLTEKDIELHKWYGDGTKRARIMAYIWGDGPQGVNYAIEGVFTIDALWCSKEEFLETVNNPNG